MMIKVTAAKPLEDCQWPLSFNTGETRVFDVGPYLHKGIFTELPDPSYFRSGRLAFGRIGGDGESSPIYLIEKIVTGREDFRSSDNSVSQLDHLLVDLESLEHEGHWANRKRAVEQLSSRPQ